MREINFNSHTKRPQDRGICVPTNAGNDVIAIVTLLTLKETLQQYRLQTVYGTHCSRFVTYGWKINGFGFVLPNFTVSIIEVEVCSLNLSRCFMHAVRCFISTSTTWLLLSISRGTDFESGVVCLKISVL